MPTTYSIAIVDEQTGRILRKLERVPARTAEKIASMLDTGAEISSAVVDLVGAARTIGRALEPLTRPRTLPARRRRK